jgi:HK97 gp10 family phage protein
MGRKTGKGVYRVSDPNAAFGVPVATGALQNTITKSVKRQGKKIVGEIDAGLNLVYAKMIEFGTSRMAARPFMRPAWNENLQWIKSKWKEKITKI